MQATKSLQLVLILGATFTCLAFLNKYPNISYKIDKNNIFPLANVNSIHSKNSKINTLSQQRLRSKIQQRLKNIEHFCENHNRTRQFEMVVSKLIIDVKHGISWCPIYKAASSVWMRQFAKFGGILTDETRELVKQNAIQISTLVNNLYNTESNINETLQRIKETQTFLVVRNPFERLLSAYRDKLEHKEGRDYYYRRFGRHITYKYRKNKNENKRSEPLFVEFLEFIAREKYFDEHWIPYTEACLPCDIKYNYVLKFETFEEESKFLLLQLGLQDELDFIRPKNSVGTESVIENYYSKVPVTLLKKIYNIYEQDFKLFSYTPDKYYSLGQKEVKISQFNLNYND